MLSFNRYPHYEILNDPDISQSAGLNKRYTDESLRGIILDIHFLSKCDYLVCTFSSQVTFFPSISFLYILLYGQSLSYYSFYCMD